MASAHGSTPHVLGRGSWGETSRVAQILRKETLGGALLLAGPVLALVLGELPVVARLRVARLASPRGRSFSTCA